MNIYTLSTTALKIIMHLWPPFWFTGISFEFISSDFRHIRTAMSLRHYNKNLHGIQYGGNLYSMTDPCHTIMVIRNLGPEYRVIDKAAHIEFIKPGTTKVVADCTITEADLDEIKKNTANGEKYFKDFSIEVVDANGETVAKILKTVYIRKKRSDKAL